jgi:hypothetical protein
MDFFYAGHLWGWLRDYSRRWTLEDLHQLPVHQAAQLYYAYSRVEKIDEAVATEINRLVTTGAPPKDWQARLVKLDRIMEKTPKKTPKKTPSRTQRPGSTGRSWLWRAVALVSILSARADANAGGIVPYRPVGTTYAETYHLKASNPHWKLGTTDPEYMRQLAHPALENLQGFQATWELIGATIRERTLSAEKELLFTVAHPVVLESIWKHVLEMCQLEQTILLHYTVHGGHIRKWIGDIVTMVFGTGQTPAGDRLYREMSTELQNQNEAEVLDVVHSVLTWNQAQARVFGANSADPKKDTEIDMFKHKMRMSLDTHDVHPMVQSMTDRQFVDFVRDYILVEFTACFLISDTDMSWYDTNMIEEAIRTIESTFNRKVSDAYTVNRLIQSEKRILLQGTELATVKKLLQEQTHGFGSMLYEYAWQMSVAIAVSGLLVTHPVASLGGVSGTVGGAFFLLSKVYRHLSRPTKCPNCGQRHAGSCRIARG